MTRGRALLIHNPASTSASAAQVERVEGILSRRWDVAISATKQRGHASHLAAGAVHDQVDLVFSLGGDGTANEVVQALATTQVAFCPLPAGGTNVLARGLGLPNDAADAAEVALEVEEPRPMTLGLAGSRWFTFIAGLGFDAAIVRRVEQRPVLKRRFRQLAFVWCGLAEWFAGGAGVAAEVHLDLPGGPALGPFAITMVGNGDPYTYLGPRPLRLMPEADFRLGLDVLATSSLSTPQVVAILGKAFTTARHGADPRVTLLHDLPSFTLRCDRALPLMVDGDYAGDHHRVEFRAVSDALRVHA